MAGLTSEGSAALRETLTRRLLACGPPGSRVSIGRAARDRPLRLSFDQQRWCALDRQAPGSPVHLVPLVLRLTGELDVVSLRRAFTELVSRHEILRTRYDLTGAEPVQRIDPVQPPDWTFADLTELPAGRREPGALRLAERLASTPIDLERDRPLRLGLLRTGERHHILVVVCHGITLDSRSHRLLLGELAALYNAFRAGGPAPLPDPPVQYADYAAWQRLWFSEQAMEHHLWYWRTQLAGSAPLHLRTDRDRPPARDWRGAAVPVHVCADTTDALRAIADEHDASLFMVLLTAFQCLLARHTGRPDIAVGTTVCGRTHPELRHLLGVVANTVVLRMRIRGTPSFSDMVVRNRITVLEALDHRPLPFASLVAALRSGRDAARTPLFQIAFAMDAPGTETDELAGLRVERQELPCRVARHDLTLRVAERPDGSLSGRFEFATSLFDAATMRHLAGELEGIVARAAADPGATVDALGAHEAGRAA